MYSGSSHKQSPQKYKLPFQQFGQCQQILPYYYQQKGHKLFLGNIHSLQLHIIKKLQIGAIITVLDTNIYQKYDIGSTFKQLWIRFQKDQSISKNQTSKNNHMWINILDQNSEENSLYSYFQQTFEFIEQNIQKTNVLVHCKGGISRSASIVIAYIMKKNKYSYAKAKQFVKSKRQKISQNPQFIKDLKKYEKMLEYLSIKDTVITDPQTQFAKEQYLTKFCNHIICLKNPSILESHNIFLGQATAVKTNYLKNLQIKSVLSLMTQQQYIPLKIDTVCDEMNIEHKFVEFKNNQNQNIALSFEQCILFIEKTIQQGNVLIHCKNGKSRSASIVIAYLMNKFPLVSYQNVQNFVKQKRSTLFNLSPELVNKIKQYSYSENQK